MEEQHIAHRSNGFDHSKELRMMDVHAYNMGMEEDRAISRRSFSSKSEVVNQHEPDPRADDDHQGGQSSSWWSALVGDYDWGFLCTPRIPCRLKSKQAPFFLKDEKIPFLLAVVMGLQHALAMVAGIITAPAVIASSAGFTPKIQAYMVSSALIVTSVASFIQVYQVKLPFTKYVIGSGLLSVMGTSFAYVPVAQHVLPNLMSCSCNGDPCKVGGSCLNCSQALHGPCNTEEEAYGAILGTVMVVCWFQTALSFASPRVIRRIFPPVVTGTCLVLLGASLVGTGFELWGGGQACATQALTSKILCTGNGDVILPFAHIYYVGLGLVVFLSFIVIEMFGSPFMRNTQVIIALIISIIVASAVRVRQCKENCASPVCQQPICYNVLPQGVVYNTTSNTISGSPLSSYPNSTVCSAAECAAAVCQGIICQSLRFVTGQQISQADWVTFLWTHKFPLKLYAPAVLPLLVASIVAATECIGDVTATTEASGLKPYGPEFETSIQGALLADGINAFWAALGTSIPLTTYAQNNGVISLSRCASRRAGYACCVWLFLLGVFAKFAAIFVTIPNCILGAITTCLVASVVVSGIHVMNLREGLNRRNRFIATFALGIGLGVTIIPTWVNISGQSGYPNEGNLWPVDPTWSAGYRGFRDSIILFVSNGFSIGGFTAFLLNLILPFEGEKDEHDFVSTTEQ